MEKKRAVELLIQEVDKIPYLKTLSPENNEFRLWLKNAGNIVNEGLEPEDKSEFHKASQSLEYLRSPHEGNLIQQDYVDEIVRYEIALKSIIQRYEILAIAGEGDKGGEVENKTNKKEVMTFLSEKIDELSKLDTLPPDNIEFPTWCKEIEIFLYKSFGKDSIEYETFKEAGIIRGIVEGSHTEYRKAIKSRETALFAIALAHEKLLGEKPMGLKDKIELSIQLFDAMQFHPKVVEVSKDCFIAGNYREAILNAFICLIDYVKERTGLDLDGDDLMNQVFSINYDKEQRRITKYPIIRINKLQNKSDRDEQQGFMFLCKGAAGGIRNPKAHKLIPQSNPLHTLEYLAFASLLMRRIEEGKVVRTNQSRRKWDWDIFIQDTKNKCEQKIIALTKNLYGFTSVNSDSISWGTGINDGSFTFRKLSINGEISIFSVYSCGWVYINFGSMINKSVPDSIIETFRTSLNSIPNINIPKSAITDGKYARIYESPLTNPNNLQIFKDAVILLCQQLENN